MVQSTICTTHLVQWPATRLTPQGQPRVVLVSGLLISACYILGHMLTSTAVHGTWYIGTGDILMSDMSLQPCTSTCVQVWWSMVIACI